MNEEYTGNSIIKQEESYMVFEQSKNPKKKLNPMDKPGKITRCVICNSKMHWAKNCLHKTNTKSVNVAEIISDDDVGCKTRNNLQTNQTTHKPLTN